ncbi:succinylglutamate desuccinylase/aspartoacylase family protein [Mangrovimicrobium sediminis]|uniref:Succinylglutamate desuccinylase/aspartoacylase family protein n=1 Tax=Mangrovimicrobium sediminis TaxID=2562682 RepID=A0A4Z0M8H5_9GAMM|nr:succinylglutamate desuccinylase/aspartoacylase family protein [Haliea sp. SAOS-164]TGD75700.1 succinylglutamate desuccinylase/aspartoacylase family protein [Haliea sp. SAOS-164]
MTGQLTIRVLAAAGLGALLALSALAVESPTPALEAQEAASGATPESASEAAPVEAAEGAEGTPAKAVSVELDEPVVEEPVVPPPVVEPAGTEVQPDDPQEVLVPIAEEEVPPAPPEPTLVLLGTEIPPATTTRLSWSPSHTLEGIATPTPVLIVNGRRPGPVLCLTAALHGDELNGIEIVRRILYNLDKESLVGTVIGVPIVNLQGFHRSSRYLADRRDLNRYFPGNPSGSSASRIAHSFFEGVIRHCSALVDLHTGSFHRTNMPQLRADLRYPQVRELTEAFGTTVVLQSGGASGSLRRAAVEAGIPALTLEAGESMRLQEAAVEHGVDGITTLMSKMGMIERFSLWGYPEPVYYRSVWVRADRGGILFSVVNLADRVRKGDLLGEVTDPITNISSKIYSPHDGRVIGMALNQVVLPGFAAFHIAIATPKKEVEEMAWQAGAAAREPAGEAAAVDPNNPNTEATIEDPDASDAGGDPPELPDSDDFD